MPTNSQDAIIITIEGVQQPAGSKRAFLMQSKGRIILRKNGSPMINVVDANKNAAPWKKLVADQARLTYSGPLLTGPLELCVDFDVVRPKSHFTKSGKPSSAWRSHPTVKPDATKLLRAVEDALTSIVWKDDAQIVLQTVSKAYGDKSLTVICVKPMEVKP
jgi:Holliday junction resolvase RusA-like endonuclease